MVDQVIKHHGGQVQVFSSLGQGTVFAITLPCQPPEEFSDSRGAPDR
jgi:signal transduction histidine kinase